MSKIELPEGLEDGVGDDDGEEGDGGETSRKNELIFLAGRVYRTRGQEPEQAEG